MPLHLFFPSLPPKPMGIRDWFAPRQQFNLPVPSLPAPVDINHAMEVVLVQSVKSQAETAATIGKAITEQLLSMAEIQQALFAKRRRSATSVRTAAGQKRKRGRFDGNKCRLCENPSIQNPTVAEITAHASHESANFYVTEDQFQERADGTPVIECEDCVKNTPGHTHHVH